MPKTRIYVEGGGKSDALRTECRRGFSEFLEKAGLEGRMPKIIACGPRNEAFKQFGIASSKYEDELIILLVDSESLIGRTMNPLTHLNARDKWDIPSEINPDNVHLMAQCMETWLIADPDALGAYFGQGFNQSNLPQHSDLEAVSKNDIFQSLNNATRATRSKKYSKGNHSFQILRMIDPAVVRAKCSFADRFIAYLLDSNAPVGRR